MKKLLPLELLLLLSAFTANAQSGMPPAYEIKTDTALFTPLPDKYVQVLEDKEGNLTFDQVQQTAEESKFYNSSLKKLDFYKHTYWFRYTLKNVMPQDAHICLPVNSEESVFYIKSDDGQWGRFDNGYLTSWNKESGLKLRQVVPVVIKASKEVVIFNRIYNGNGYYYFPIGVSVGFACSFATAQGAAEEKRYIKVTHDSIFFGILFLAVILNFFFFLAVHERVYLYFSIYLLLIGIERTEDAFYFIFLREFRVFHTYLINFALAFNWVFLTLFIRSLLHIKIHLPRWDKFLTAFTIYLIVLGCAIVLGPFNWYADSPFYSGYISIFSNIADIAIILLSFFLLLIEKKLDRTIATFILPAYLIWGVCWPIPILYDIFRYTIVGKNLTTFLDHWWYPLESACLTWLVICFSWILLQRFRRLQKQVVQEALDREKEKNQLIAEQKVELEKTVDERTSELKHSLAELQSTQSQLIQREKMASLGELTAGIAHEIQNPLNFVNNFSEVNEEMFDDLKEALESGDTEEALSIANDLQENEKKIRHHGKRADFIVKGMLEHSRASTGERQATNINVLADEFMKLSYHGIRAKDNSFNAELVTHFDDKLPRINIVPQDIGRVLINLFGNAFYAVNQKVKIAGPGYKPVVEVRTMQQSGSVIISVKDNGNGISDNIKDKIFQPFFTTKPTGEGTGLGLSLSYDIVVKGHGGNIVVESWEGKGSEFTVSLPLS